MKLHEYLSAINMNLVVRCCGNREQPWYAHFENGEVMERGMLVGKHGNGMTANEAIVNFLKSVGGKRVAFYPSEKEMRREFVIPVGLEL